MDTLYFTEPFTLQSQFTIITANYWNGIGIGIRIRTRICECNVTLAATELVVMREEFEEEVGDDAGDADEEVGNNEDDISRTGLVKHKRYWIHHRCDRPAAIKQNKST